MKEQQAHLLLKPYPIFRLTLFLVAGIFLSLSVGSEGCSEEVLWLLRGMLGLLLLLLGVGVGLSRFEHRYVFGWGAFTFMGFLGVLLGQERIREVRYDWPSEPCAYRALLLESPQEKARTFLCRLQVDVRCDEDRCIPVHREVWAYIRKDSLSEQLQTGDGIHFYAQVETPCSSDLPDEFDYAAYLYRKGVSGTAVVLADRWHRAGDRKPLTWKQRALLCREQVLSAYRDWGFSGDEGAVLAALTVGYKADLSKEVQATYRQAGVSHILALSGMHVAILWGLLAFILRPLARIRGGRWLQCLLIVGLLWAFAFLVGLSASVVRAVVMCSLLVLSRASVTEYSLLNSLSIAAAGMLCYDPFYLFDVGFQLSFLAVFSIFLLYPLFFSLWNVHQPVARYVWGIVSVSLSAQVGTSPLIMYYFSHFPVYFLLANVWVAPLVCLIVYGTVLLWVTSPLGAVHGWVIQGLKALLTWMNAGLRQLGAWPLSDSGAVHLSPLLVVALYLCLSFVWLLVVYRSHRFWIGLLLALHGVAAAVYFQPATSAHVKGLYLHKGQVKAYPEKALWQSDSLFRFQGVTVCLVTSDRWEKCRSSSPLEIDYLYLCRGYRGKITTLQSLFTIRKVVLDSSLPAYLRKRYEEECLALGIDYVVMGAKGSYQILPQIRN